MRAIIIDDEAKTRQIILDKLQTHCPQVKIVAEAPSAAEAYDAILAHTPDVIFLDIAMPKESGFDLLRRLPSLNFEIIFVTGYDQYAIDAIRFCAIGYVLKPVQTDELVAAVQKAAARVTKKMEHNRNQQLLQNLANPGGAHNRIGIPTEEGIEFVETQKIIRCEGENKYTRIILMNQSPILSAYNLGEFTKLLRQYGFYTPHKSHLINMSHIKRFDKEGIVYMIDDSNVPVSRRRRQDFLEQLTRI